MHRLTVITQQAKAGPPLSPMLGQIQVKVQDFITEFNNQCVDYNEGIPVNCRISKSGLKFNLVVLPPSFFTMFWGLSNQREISVSSIYDCFLFRFNRVPTPIETRILLGSLQSSSFKIASFVKCIN